MGLPSNEEIAEIQNTEVEVLQSILGEDIVILPSESKVWKNAPQLRLHQFEIILRPEDDALKSLVSAVLVVRLPKTYPYSPPIVTVPLTDPSTKSKPGEPSRIQGISKLALRELDTLLQKRIAKLEAGQEAVWELVSFAQEYISSHHAIGKAELGVATAAAAQGTGAAVSLSLQEQMRIRAEEEQRMKALEREEEARKREEEEEKRKGELARRIQEEEARKLDAFKATQPAKAVATGVPSPVKTAPPRLTFPNGQDAHSATAETELFLDGISLGAIKTHTVRIGPILAQDDIRTTYLADSAETGGQMSEEGDPISWQLQRYIISNPFYTTLGGKKQLEEVDDDLERLRTLRDEHLLTVHAVSLSRNTGGEGGTHTGANDGWRIVVVTERPPGPSLRSVLEQCEVLPWTRVRIYARALLSALVALHGRSLVHRCLDTNVVYVSAKGKGARRKAQLSSSVSVKLADSGYHRRLLDLHAAEPFSEAQEDDAPAHQDDVPTGWIAPESANDRTLYSRNRDTWDLGRLLCQMLFGLDCVDDYGTPVSLLEDKSGALDGRLPPAISGDIRSFIGSLMHPEPRKRPSAKAALTTLEDLITFEESNQLGSTTLVARHPELMRKQSSLAIPAPERVSLMRREGTATDLLGTSPEAVHRASAFWNLTRAATAISEPQATWSRYRSDFEELEFLGKGAFGSVVKARNKLDGRFFAIKKIRLSDGVQNDERTLREVTALSRLNHAHVVRYVTCWIEQELVTDLTASEASIATTSTDAGRGGRSRSRKSRRDGAGSVSFHLDLEAELEADFLSISHDAFSQGKGNHGIDFAEDSESEDDSSESSDDSSSSGGPLGIVRRAQPIATSGAASRAKSRDGMRDIWSRAGFSADTSELPSKTRRTLFIQMEYISGSTLRDSIDRGLSVEEAWRILRQMLEALAHINHSMGIIHRDLKPSNVLMAGEADVKIGDFGLATTDLTKAMEETRNPSDSIGDLTGDVGTNLYMSPEVIHRTGRYDAKVDMYSLGIIFFEMLASQRAYKTGMERVSVLRDLRQPDVKLPTSWPFAADSAETKVVNWLLTHKASERPTPIELLRSELLPSKLEDDYLEECLRLMANPRSTYNDRLLQAIFERDDIDDVRDFTFDMGAETDADRPLITAVCEHLRGIFHRHGAVQVRIPPLIPPNEFYASQVAEKKMVRLLDRSGRLVFLPFDGMLPFARAFRSSDNKRFKRYDIASVFRDNPIAGGQPRSVLEVNFDIVSPERTAASEAEIFKVLQEIVDEIPGLRQDWILQLNHRAVLDLVLERIPKRQQAAVTELFASTLGLKVSASAMQETRTKLFDMRLSRSVIDELEAANMAGKSCSPSSLEERLTLASLSGPVEDVRAKLERLLPVEHRKVLSTAVAEITRITSAMRAFGVTLQVQFTPLLSHNASFFKGGSIFQLVRLGKKRIDVLAAGGRYDSLLKRFANPSSTTSPPHGVGVQVAVGKIALALSRYQELQVPHLMGKTVEEERSFGWWTPRRCGECPHVEN